MLVIYIFIGGGIGSVLRYFFASQIGQIFGAQFPYGTFSVNVVGSFLMGLLMEFFSKTIPHDMELRAFLAVGILGGFTTFSAFSRDAVILFERGDFSLALMYVLSSVIFSILAVFGGFIVMRLLVN